MAHVDTPQGDLDHSGGALSTVYTTDASSGQTDGTFGMIFNPLIPTRNGDSYPEQSANVNPTSPGRSNIYPFGVDESFPSMLISTDIRGDGVADGTDDDLSAALQTNTAHWYMECSNKGMCDRKTGECECFEGYEGTSCQRASCPNDCNGHGTCHTIQYLANEEYNNVYELWDAKMTMGCKCDAPYFGADCSSRACKYGTDPLYGYDSPTNGVYTRVNTVNLDIVSDTLAYTCGTATTYATHPLANEAVDCHALAGTYAIKFYDVFGEDYITDPIIAVDGQSTDMTNLEEDSGPSYGSSQYGPGTLLPNGQIVGPDQTLTYTGAAGSAGAHNDPYDPHERGIDTDGSGTIDADEMLHYVSGEQTWFGPHRGTKQTPALHCRRIVQALKALPNKVITDVTCTGNVIQQGFPDIQGTQSVITFTGNPGPLKQIEIERYLDGVGRSTLFSYDKNGKAGTVTVNVYQQGISGEFTDYFANRCGVTVTPTAYQAPAAAMDYQAIEKMGPERVAFLSFESATATEDAKTLKRCLGDNDGITANNVEVYDWDYGYFNSSKNTIPGQYLHAIKLQEVDAPTNSRYLLTWYDGNTFHLANKPMTNTGTGDVNVPHQPVNDLSSDGSSGKKFNVFATDGVARRLHSDPVYGDDWSALQSTVTAGASNAADSRGVQYDTYDSASEGDHVLAYFSQYSNTVYTSYDTSCQNAVTTPCLDKGDLVFLIDGYYDKRAKQFLNGINFTDYLMGYRPESRNANFLNDGQGSPGPNNPTPSLYKNENGTAGDGGLYTITKVWTQDHDYISTMSGYYDTRYRFTVDRNIPWDGTAKVEHMDQYLTAFAGEMGEVGTGGVSAIGLVEPHAIDRSNEYSGTGGGYLTTDADGGGQSAAQLYNLSGSVAIWKFTPSATGAEQYTHTSQCSNRGICDTEAGVCQCFTGYTNDNCDTQSALAV
jgi:hypothetical protein